MNRVLHIDASPRGDRSTSRKLGNEFIGDTIVRETSYHDTLNAVLNLAKQQ